MIQSPALKIGEQLIPRLVEKEGLQGNTFSKKRLAAFSISFFQFFALFVLIDHFKIESASGIKQVAPFIFSAFVINSFVSLRFRQLVLFFTCICIIYFAFGFFSGSVLITVGLMLILSCHLPVYFWLRVFFVLAIAAGVFILRADLFYAPRGSLVAPFIASMFMFRIIIYLYEIKHGMRPPSIIQSITYFFLFPNICFLFFPIIDYKTYIKTYYNIPDGELWQKGIRWMLRGIIHIIAYRIIYYYVVISPSEVTDLFSLLRFLISGYMLVLRLSGMFHFILGLLCMFGLNLPPAFDNYFLATSFIDQWRRINIYWREFILKIFFYPIMFKIKKISIRFALPLTMFCIFVISWILHGYQWFWIRGYYVFSVMDMSFWLLLGIFITANAMILEKKFGNKKSNLNELTVFFIRMLKIIGMLLFMSLLWSLWESRSFSEWFFLLSKSKIYSANELIIIAGIIAGSILAGVIAQVFLKKEMVKKLISQPPQKTTLFTLISIIILFLCSSGISETIFPVPLNKFIKSLQNEKLNKNDREVEEEGYYQTLIDGENNNPTGLWEIHLKRAKRYNALDDIYIRTNDILTKVFKPNSEIHGNNYTLTTNSFGIRDKEYPVMPDNSSFRIAILGGSYEMGSGVNNEDVFETITEEKLNETSTDSVIKKYELLNFACGGFYLIQHVELCETKVFKFKPDAVVYFSHTGERWRMLLTLTNLIRQGANLKYPFLEGVKKITGVKQSMSKAEIEDRLKPHIDLVIKWCYLKIANDCYMNKSIPVWAFLPTTTDVYDPEEYATMKRFAKEYNYITLDLRGVYDNKNMKEMIVSDYDTHPSKIAHQLIAEKFYFELLKSKPLLTERKK